MIIHDIKRNQVESFIIFYVLDTYSNLYIICLVLVNNKFIWNAKICIENKWFFIVPYKAHPDKDDFPALITDNVYNNRPETVKYLKAWPWRAHEFATPIPWIYHSYENMKTLGYWVDIMWYVMVCLVLPGLFTRYAV